MSKAKPDSPGAIQPEDSPIAWFAEMILAVDRGNFEQAAESQRQLSRLGWRVDRRKIRQTADRQDGDL
jgi:hypothetical protein